MSADTAPAFIAPEDAAALLAAVPEPQETAPPEPDTAPTKRRRSGTSGAERARRAKEAGTADKAPRQPRATSSAADDKAVAAGVRGIHELAGKLVLPAVGMPATGAALVASAPDAAEVWTGLARRYPAVRKMFSTGGDGVLFVQLFMVYAPLVMLAQTERAAGGAVDPTALFAGLADPAGT